MIGFFLAPDPARFIDLPQECLEKICSFGSFRKKCFVGPLASSCTGTALVVYKEHYEFLLINESNKRLGRLAQIEIAEIDRSEDEDYFPILTSKDNKELCLKLEKIKQIAKENSSVFYKLKLGKILSKDDRKRIPDEGDNLKKYDSFVSARRILEGIMKEVGGLYIKQVRLLKEDIKANNLLLREYGLKEMVI